MKRQSLIPDELRDAEFLSKKAGSFSEVAQRTVQSWTERGLVKPDKADTTGTGKRRLYSAINCVEIAIIKALSARLPMDRVEFCMKYLLARPKLEELFKKDQGFLVVHVKTARVIKAPTSSLVGYLKGEEVNFQEWKWITTPSDGAEVIIFDINGAARKIIERIH